MNVEVTTSPPLVSRVSAPHHRSRASHVLLGATCGCDLVCVWSPDSKSCCVCVCVGGNHHLAPYTHTPCSASFSCVSIFSVSPPGKSYTMIGRDDSLQTLGIIPCAISWLFKLINERKEKTGARFSVRVSAVEVSATVSDVYRLCEHV